ncbi:hypothetical protein BASA83_004676 [Batrachochytrium salamandrivorans]|nr:hypothetical protein BASA83_004676 [Batrachochytrium salamandrivorans]
MKLISFFVGAMVITSANAGWFDTLWQKIKNIQSTIPSVEFSLGSSSSEPSSLEPSPSEPSSLEPSPSLEQSVASSTSNSMSVVQKQKKDNPTLEHMFNDDEEHNAMLMELSDLQISLFKLMSQLKYEYPQYRALVNIAGHLTSEEFDKMHSPGKPRRQMIEELLDEIENCLGKFESLMLQYLEKYLALPKDSAILSLENLYKELRLFKEELFRTD